VLPAVDVGKSVSRVGGEAQHPAFRAIAGNLKLAYAQFEELETFSRFGARLDEATRATIEHGKRIRACLKQSEFSPVTGAEQIVLLLALTENLMEGVPMERMIDAEKALQLSTNMLPEELRGRIDGAEKLSDEDRKTIIDSDRAALVPFQL